MKKRKVFLISLELIVLVSLTAIFLFYYSQKSNYTGMTGFAIYTDQPDSTTGKDTYIMSGAGSEYNFGVIEVIKIGNTTSAEQYRGFIEFNLSSIPSGNSIVSAIVQLHVSLPPERNMTIKVYRVTSFWNESVVNWSSRNTANLWSTAGGDYTEELDSIIITNETNSYYNITITDAVRKWINGSSPNYGIMLISENANNGNTTEIDSSDSGNGPQIIVHYEENIPPIISNISTDSSLTNPKQVGRILTFNVTWYDLEGDTSNYYVCNSSNITVEYGCIGKTFCNSSKDITSPKTCNYTVSISDNRTTEFWVATCDNHNCSSANKSYFYVNHLPSVLVVRPNGSETINQTKDGNYTINFNVSDMDLDSLTANIYYGENQNSTEHIIATDLDLNLYCIDEDSNKSTANICNYSWNTTGIYGSYFLTIITNDSYNISLDSSNNYFYVRSLIDMYPPEITSQWLEDNYLYSGKLFYVYANVSDPNIDSVWVSFDTGQNITMINISSIIYRTVFDAQTVGNHSFKIYARDILGNLNDSMDWQEFNVSKPIAYTGKETSPPIALPYQVIRVSGQLNSTTGIKDVYAYLNTPEGFLFFSDYPQNNNLGNFSENETKNATWFLSVPLIEGNYTFNITYTDGYSNQWNSSSFSTEVTSAIWGYTLTLSGYPEVETSHPYYAEATFTQNYQYVNPDTITLLIYDSMGSQIVGPVSMTQESIGKYNYTFSVGTSVAEGQWETIVNATKGTNSYYKNQFWNVVGGPFDVRNITIEDSDINHLQISVITENTGGATKDLTLVWNLTRVDTGELLDSDANTYAVNASSERKFTIYPSTTYIGQVRITFLGYYSGTEKAGAYKIFSTTSSGVTPPGSSGGGGGGNGGTKTEVLNISNDSFEIQDYERIVYITKNIEKTTYLTINNTGIEELKDIVLLIENLNEVYSNIDPPIIDILKQGEIKKFAIKFLTINFTGEKDAFYVVKTDKITKREPVKIIVLSMKDYYLKEVQRIKDKLDSLRKNLENAKKSKLLSDLEDCKSILDNSEVYVNAEKFKESDDNLKKAESCIDTVNNNFKKPETTSMQYKIWVTTWVLMLIVAIILTIFIYLLYRRLNLFSIIRGQEHPLVPRKPKQKVQLKEKRVLNPTNFDKKIKEIQDKLEK
jgi:hypothetical protein